MYNGIPVTLLISYQNKFYGGSLKLKHVTTFQTPRPGSTVENCRQIKKKNLENYKP